jgi:hypothetical protein
MGLRAIPGDRRARRGVTWLQRRSSAHERELLGHSVQEAGGVRAIVEHLGLATAGAELAPARGPHKAAWCCGSSSQGQESQAPAAHLLGG